MGLFNKNQTAAPKSPEATFAVARSNLLLVIGFTLVNVILRLVSADMYFLFSASTPLAFLDVAAVIGDGALPVCAVLAFLTIGLYVLCWALSKKRPGWIVVALVLFVVDTLVLLGLYELEGMIFDLLIHVWVLYYLITGTVAMVKMKRQPPVPEMVIDPTVTPSYVTDGVPMAQPMAETPAAPEAAVVETAPVLVNGEPIHEE